MKSNRQRIIKINPLTWLIFFTFWLIYCYISLNSSSFIIHHQKYKTFSLVVGCRWKAKLTFCTIFHVFPSFKSQFTIFKLKNFLHFHNSNIHRTEKKREFLLVNFDPFCLVTMLLKTHNCEQSSVNNFHVYAWMERREKKNSHLVSTIYCGTNLQ